MSLCCLTLIVACVVLLPGTAQAAVTYTSQLPGVNATVAANPGYMSVFVDADSEILTSSVMSIDGVAKTTYVDWLGHYEDPDCNEQWVVDDYTAATVSAAIGNLDEGVHTISVAVHTQSTGILNYSWSFTVDYPDGSAATFSSFTPANGANLTTNPTISVRAQSVNTIHSSNCRIIVDGVEYTPNWTSGTTVTLSIGTRVVPDGPHTVVVRVRDSIGMLSETSWSFTTGIPPAVTGMFPANGTTVKTPTPAIGAYVTDNTPGQVTVRLVVDGIQVFNALTNQGAFSWTQTPPYIASGSHPVQMTVTDSGGRSTVRSWTFYAQATPAMSDASSCGGCHPLNEHPMDNCYACHSADYSYGDHSSSPSGPVTPCWDCHGGYPTPHSASLMSWYDCAYCHANTYFTWSHIPGGHDASTIPTLHYSATTGCEDCHDRALVTEHGKYPHDTAFKYQCATCHASTNSAVVTAISGNDTRCESCHAATQGHLPAHVSPTNATCFGTGCHDASRNLVSVHERYAGAGSPNASYTTSCRLCHSNPSVNTTTAGLSCTGSCHSVATHSEYASKHAPTAASASCTAAQCHGTDLSAIHGALTDFTKCDLCHANKDNWTKTADCSSCHTDVSHEAAHGASPEMESSCLGCHSDNLVTEHVYRRNIPCSRCHGSGFSLSGASADTMSAHVAGASPVAAAGEISMASEGMNQSDIETAIANGDTSCYACHTPGFHPPMLGTWGADDYYSWESTALAGGAALSSVGANPTNPGVHAGYLATTAKCGICHSVHRAAAQGVKLLNAQVATCAGCHRAGVSTVTDKVISWEAGGPHFSGVNESCTERRCHTNSPHGVGTSTYALFGGKLITDGVDATVGAAAASAGNGFTVDNLTGAAPLGEAERRSIVTGYTCNQPDCHYNTLLAVLTRNYSELRDDVYPLGEGDAVTKTGHLTVAPFNASAASYAPVASCTSCHDQTDAATKSGYTFPHSQVAAGSTNLAGRAYLWMGYASHLGSTLQPVASPEQKAYDGTCLKCHRDAANTAGIGLTR